MIGLFAFMVSVAYVPWFNGAAVSLRWAIMAVGAAVLVSSSRTGAPPTIRKADAIGLAFLVWCVVSLAWSPVFYDAANELMQFGILALLFIVGSRLENLRPVYIGFGTGIAVNGVLMLAQRTYDFGITEYFELGHGLFFNADFAGEAAVLVIVALAGQHLWHLVAAAWPSLILSGSRAALVGLSLAGACYLWGRSKLTAILVMVACAVALAAAVSVGLKAQGIEDRINLWSDVIGGLTWLGHGVGSFWVTIPEHITQALGGNTRPDHAHNDLLELTYELGFCGACLAVWFAVELCRSAESCERLVLVAFAALAMVAFPLHNPATAFLFAVVAGHAARGSVELRIPVAVRRMGVFGPASRAARVS